MSAVTDPKRTSDVSALEELVQRVRATSPTMKRSRKI